MQPKRDPLRPKDTYILKVMRSKNIFHANGGEKSLSSNYIRQNRL